MGYAIKIASSQQEREAIYRFRYKVYMEELNKNHIAADHDHKILFDEADDHHRIFYAGDGNDLIATVRAQSGSFGKFTISDNDFFGINEFAMHIDYNEIAIVDRLMVNQQNRHSSLAGEMMLTTYFFGIETGTRICFISCDEKLLAMYLKYGFRIYRETALLITGEKRFKLILFLCDRNHLQKVNSPFFKYLPKSLDDNGKYAKITEEKLGFTLTDHAETVNSFITKNAG